MSEKNKIKKDNISLPKKILMIFGSLFIALVLWYVGITQDHTPISKQFTDIPVVYRGEEVLEQNGFTMNGIQGAHVDVVLRGYASEMFAINGDMLVAVIDVSQYNKSGKYSILPIIEGAAGEFTVTAADSIDIEIEKHLKKSLSINIEFEGKPYRGYKIAEDEIRSLGTIEISCGEELIDTVVSARIVVNVDGKKATFSVNAPVELLDAEGNVVNIEDVTLEFENVDVEIPIYAAN